MHQHHAPLASTLLPSPPSPPLCASVTLLCLLMLLSGPLARAADAGLGATNPPLITIRQFLDGARAWGEQTLVRVQGTVIHSISDKTFFIQDSDAGTYVFHKPATAFRVGELVEIIGSPSLGGFAPTLQHCQVRALGPGPLPVPEVMTAAKARRGEYGARLIRVQGELAAERLRGGHILVLNPGQSGDIFTADLEAFADLQPFRHFRPGSLLELTGVCSIRRDAFNQPTAFNLFIRSPADLVVLKAPSWWTPSRTWRVLGLATAGLILALAWILTLRRQVSRQTAQSRRRLEQEAALERQYSELVENASRELEQRVVRRTAELTQANKELEAFSYSVSHDLRAPLRHISGFAHMVVDHPALAAQPNLQRPLSLIIAAASRMGRLVDDLLTFSRLNRQALSPCPVPLEPLVAEVLNDLQPDTADRAIEWKISPLPEVHGDPATLKLVWQNLLGNAVKYTRQRTPAMIEVDCHQGELEWTFIVRDNGAGFDMRYADRLFGVFQRLHSEEEFEGTGVGLAHVRRILQRHGGRVWAEAEVDRGATFSFTLPRTAPFPASEARAECLAP